MPPLLDVSIADVSNTITKIFVVHVVFIGAASTTPDGPNTIVSC